MSTIQFGKAVIFVSLVLFFSCSKQKNNCPETLGIDITMNKDLFYKSNTMILSAPTSALNTYEWSGPGGWTSNLPVPKRVDLQYQDAGIYSVKIFNSNKCLVYQSSKNIAVNTPPPSPCSLAENTISSTTGVAGNFSFNYPANLLVYTQNSYFYYYAFKGAESIAILFPGTQAPETGIYTTFAGYPSQSTTAFVQLIKQGIEYRSAGGDNLYYTMEGNQKKIVCCDIRMFEFNNPANSFLLSMKINIY